MSPSKFEPIFETFFILWVRYGHQSGLRFPLFSRSCERDRRSLGCKKVPQLLLNSSKLFLFLKKVGIMVALCVGALSWCEIQVLLTHKSGLPCPAESLYCLEWIQMRCWSTLPPLNFINVFVFDVDGMPVRWLFSTESRPVLKRKIK